MEFLRLSGRLNRTNFAWVQLFLITIFLVIMPFAIAYMPDMMELVVLFVILPLICGLGWLFSALMRLRDINASWLWLLVCFIPLGGIFLTLYLFFAPTGKEEGKYGPYDTRVFPRNGKILIALGWLILLSAIAVEEILLPDQV